MNKIHKKIMIIAAEPSGDELGAELIIELQKKQNNFEIVGIGLDKMKALGFSSKVSLDGLAIIGLIEALGAWKKVVEKANEIGQIASEFKPDIAIFIDSWGFNLRAARAIKKYSPNTLLIKMVGPQVWATRAGRAKTVAQTYDEIWCIHEFEIPYYEGLGIKTEVIGNPAIGRNILGDGNKFREKHGFAGKKIIGILPGSRKREIKNVAPSFLSAANELSKKYPDAIFITIAASSIKNDLLKLKNDVNFDWHIFDEDQKSDGFAAMNCAIACSGTVTTELALAQVPLLIGYRLDGLTYFIARNFLLKSKYVCLLNVAMNEEIAPELLQDELNPEEIVEYISKLIDDEDYNASKISLQNEALKKMGLGSLPTAARAANLIK